MNTAVLETSLQHGGTAGFLLGIGSCLGDLIYFTIAAAGAAILLQSRGVQWTLWILGTAALLFLAWRMAQEVIRPKQPSTATVRDNGGRASVRLLAAGIGLALASPSAILWFAAAGGSIIGSFGADRRVLWPFAAGFASAGLMWAAAFAYAAASLRRFGQKFVRILSLLSALLFLYFAAVVFLEGLHRWMQPQK